MGERSAILKQEIIKIVKSPIVIAIFLIFLASDLFLVYKNYWVKDDLKVLNNIIDEVGYKINDDMMEDFKVYYEGELKKATDLIKTKEGKSYSSMDEYLKDKDIGIYKSIYGKNEERVLSDAMIIEGYYKSIPLIKNDYEKLDFKVGADDTIKSLGLSGGAEEVIRASIEKFDERFKELKENGEHLELFFNGKNYKMHKFLFGEIFRALIFQIMILIAIITSFLINYEFESGTSLVAYSTKRGRNLIYDKLKAVTIAIVILSTALIGVVLGVFFKIYDYSRVFNVSISSMFNWEFNTPNIGWFDVNVFQYLILNIFILYICIFLFIGLAFIIGRFIKSSYVAFVTCALANGIFLVFPSLMKASSELIVYSTFSPFVLSAGFGTRFMGSDVLTNFKYYEGITLGVWSLIVVVGVVYAIRSFKRMSIN